MNKYYDEYGAHLKYTVDYNELKYNFDSIKQIEYDSNIIKKYLNGFMPGMSYFDFWTLFNFIKNRKIKTVTELGCGSTTHFLQNIGLICNSFSLAAEDSVKNKVPHIECDIFESAKIILDSCYTSDLLLIDSLHTAAMAQFYHNNILTKINLPIFIHDWFDNGELGYTEQEYWIENILDKDYKLFLMTRIFDKVDIDTYRPFIVSCSAILLKI